jgi:hypothetical protein
MNPLRNHSHLLVAAYPVLALFSHNAGQVRVSEVWVTLLAIVAVAEVLYLLTSRILGDRSKSSILISVSLVLFFSYGHVHIALAGIQLGPVNFGLNRILFPIWFVLLVGTWVGIRKTGKKLTGLSVYISLVFSLLVLFSIFNIAYYKFQAWRSYRSIPEIGMHQADPPILARTADLPDIYYIIMDRYGNRTTMAEKYGFDNSEFLTWLSEQGFYVAEDSYSNYPITSHSLASSLNMEYINYLEDQHDLRPDDWMPLFQRLEKHRVQRILKNQGYTYIHVGAGWYPTSRNSSADQNINYSFMPEFPRLLSQTTILLPLFANSGFNDARREKFERIEREFYDLAEIPKLSEPAFVFAHFLLPHRPYIVDRHGEYLTRQSAERRSAEENYVGQVIHANNQLKALVSQIIEKSRIEPIIILQGDEGPYPHRISEPSFSFATATNEQLCRKMGILNAIRFPGDTAELFYPAMTPVNTFRLLFNEYFDGEYSLLPDSSYIFPDRTHLYEFENVTRRLHADQP